MTARSGRQHCAGQDMHLKKMTVMTIPGLVFMLLGSFLLFSRPVGAQWEQVPRGAQPPGPSLTPVPLPQVEEAIFTLTNDLRRQHGLAPLHRDEAYQKAARDYSTDMLQRNFFGHRDPQGISLPDRLPGQKQFTLWGENIWTGRGFPLDQNLRLAQTIMANWMVSPGHRKNILTPEYTHLGVGVAARGQEVRATQIFAGQAVK